MTLYEINKKIILDRIKLYNGRKDRAAASLGITLKTVYNKLDRYNAEERTKNAAQQIRI